MLDNSQLNQLANLIASAQSHLVIYHPQAKPSVVAAASAWFLSLKDGGAEVRLAALKKSRLNALVGLEATETDLGKQNLVLSFTYNEAAVDKISYHIGEETKKFYLTIKPKQGHPPLDAKTVEFNYAGFEADIIYLFGVSTLEELDKLYFGYEDLFKAIPLVSFHTQSTSLGTVQVFATAPSLTEDVFSLLAQLNQPISPDAATDLLYGVEAETNGLRSPLATAETFDVVARLMKLGARRVWRSKEVSRPVKSLTKAKQQSRKPRKAKSATEIKVKG